MKIIMYTKTGCPWCEGAMEFLHRENVKFEERNVTLNLKYMKEMEEKSGQSKAPTLDIDGEILPDFSADEIETYLREKGAII